MTISMKVLHHLSESKILFYFEFDAD